MKLSPQTIKILKSYTRINPNLLVKPGKVLETMSAEKSIIARIETDQEFPREFAVADINKLLGAVGLFTDPDLEFEERKVRISDGKRHVDLVYTDHTAATFVKVPAKPLNFPDPEVSFDLTEEDLKQVKDASAVLRVPDLLITGDGENVVLGAASVANPTSDSYGVTVGKTSHKFNIVIKADNVKVLPGAYKVDVALRGISRWSGTPATYYIAIQDKSKVG